MHLKLSVFRRRRRWNVGAVEWNFEIEDSAEGPKISGQPLGQCFGVMIILEIGNISSVLLLAECHQLLRLEGFVRNKVDV